MADFAIDTLANSGRKTHWHVWIEPSDIGFSSGVTQKSSQWHSRCLMPNRIQNGRIEWQFGMVVFLSKLLSMLQKVE
jgi:hypothetical protein